MKRGRPNIYIASGIPVDIDRRTLFRMASPTRYGAMPRLSGSRNDVLNGLGEWDSMNDLKELMELLLTELKILNEHMKSMTDEKINEEDITC